MYNKINSILPITNASTNSHTDKKICVKAINISILIFIFNLIIIYITYIIYHVDFLNNINLYGLCRYYTQKIFTYKLIYRNDQYIKSASGYSITEYKNDIKILANTIDFTEYIALLNSSWTNNTLIQMINESEDIKHGIDNAINELIKHVRISYYIIPIGCGINISITFCYYIKLYYTVIKKSNRINSETHQMWINVLKSCLAPCFIIDNNNNIIDWNNAMYAITGYTKENVIKLNFTDIIIGNINSKELKIICKNNNIITIIISKTKIYNNLLFCTGHNVTNILETQRNELNMKHNKWAQDIRSLFDGIDTSYVWQYRWNIKANFGYFIAISNGCYAITGYTKEEMLNSDVGCLMENILVQESYKKYLSNLKRFLTTNIKESNHEFDLRNSKRINVTILLHEKTEEYIDFIGLTTDLPHKQQLDLMVQSSKDLIMIVDDGVNNIFPKILFTSNSWKEFGFSKSPDGTFIDNYIDTIMLEQCKYEKTEQIKKYGDWDKIIVTGKMNGINVESILSKMGNKTLSVTRDITDRLKRHEVEKALAIQTTAREKDAQANSFIRHEIKNGLFSAIGQVDSMKEIYVNAIKDDDVYSVDFHSDVVNRFSEISYDLDGTLQTVLSEAMAKDIINNDYIARKEKVNIGDLINRIKGDRYKWFLNPKEIPNILSDGQLLFYIIRNALSNASKYGKQWADIKIAISIINTKLIIIIENEPGPYHDKLLKLDNHNIIFEKGVKLHKHSKLKSKSSLSAGDGAWIMQTCAKLCNGLCSIKFNPNNTIFTYEASIELSIDSDKIVNFKFPDNTIIYIIDDSNIQRRLMNVQLKNFKLPPENIKTYGKGKDEIVGLENILYENIVHFEEYYHIILSDENLDYTVDSTLYYKSGSDICKKLKEKLDEKLNKKNYITFIRSANDSKSDIEKYLTLCDGFIPKAMLTVNDLKEIIAKQWIKYFGIVQTSTINYTYDGDFKELIDLFLEDINSFMVLEYQSHDWNSFWSDLHRFKGTLGVLLSTTNTSKAITIIESLRDNNFDNDFNIIWDGLCEELKIIKVALYEESLRLQHQ